MAHRAISKMDRKNKLLYCTLPLRLGSTTFWTSNAVVASLVHVANEEGIRLPNPDDGCYPGFDGPYLPSSLFTGGATGDQNREDGFDFRGYVLLAILSLRRARRSRQTRAQESCSPSAKLPSMHH